MILTNLLTDFVKRIYGKSPVSFLLIENLLKYNFSRLAIETASIDQKKLLKAKIDLKYISILKNFS